MPRFQCIPLPERFWSKVDRRGPDECWPWTGTKRAGYGVMIIGGQHGRVVGAHRIAFLIAHGRLPHPCALHTCDNRGCVNPAHLYEGTWADNAKDRSERGLARGGRLPGARNPAAVLTAMQVRAIREAYAQGGISQCELARTYSVNHGTIFNIVHGRTWIDSGDD